jgi:hypothetical protein
MKKAKSEVIKQNSSSTISLLLFSALVITIYFNPKIADPFNATKFYLLILGASFLLGYLIFDKSVTNDKYKKLLLIVKIFIIIFLILAILTDVKYIAFIGEIQRQLGFITYLGFAIYMLVAAKYFNFSYRNKFNMAVIIMGTVYVIYGLMQHTGNDFIKWNNQYNNIIGTLGNPNFSAAFMAILATLTFSFLFNSGTNNLLKFIFLLITLGLIINIYFSNARQGLISIAGGTLTFLTIYLYKINRKLGIFSLLSVIVLAAISILGMLQSGPLEKFLYKESVSLRGYYWRAGINMLRNNLLTGVGIDRYGANFKMYREAAYPLKHGYELNSTNAHNTFIQFFATGGILLGILYLTIIFYILYCGIKGINYFKNNDRVFFSGIFSAWVAYLIQSLVSIDNIGLTIWGWILGGIIVGLVGSSRIDFEADKDQISFSIQKDNTFGILRPIFTGILVIFSLIFVITLSKSESNTMIVRGAFNPQIQDNSNGIQSYAKLVTQDEFAQLYNKSEVADLLIRSGFQNDAITTLEKVVSIDKINPTYLSPLSYMYESTGQYDNAIKTRNILVRVDPQNVKNYLQLVRLYSHIGNKSKAIEMKEKILLLAPNSEQAVLVNNEVK